MYGAESSGFSGHRRIFNNESDISEEIEGQRGTIPPPIFQIAVVVDVLTNPQQDLSPEDRQNLEKELISPELVARAPRNSIVGRVITRNNDLFDSSPRIFFPSDAHSPDPIKPGEQVFVFYVDPIVNDQIGYWWKRVPQPNDTDDLNHTHADRKYQFYDGLSTAERFEGRSQPDPDFINGGEVEEQQTLANHDDYDKINQNAKANSMVVNEPTPRFTKRPGDKVIQGSNGARIVLGMDRVGPATNPPRPNSATIDMVVGYGRTGTPTAPITVKNSRDVLEVDKTPEKRKTKDNPLEGDPDFIFDKTRVYVSESTDIDTNFQLTIPGIVPSVGFAPSLGVRTDRLRLDARENAVFKAGNVSLVIGSDGKVSIVSPSPAATINLGSADSLLGVARLNDLITIDATTDANLITFLTTLATFVAALGSAVGVPPPPPIVNPPQIITGKISQASQKVKSD